MRCVTEVHSAFMKMFITVFFFHFVVFDHWRRVQSLIQSYLKNADRMVDVLCTVYVQLVTLPGILKTTLRQISIVLLSILNATSPFCPNTPVFWCPMKTLRIYSDLPLFHCGCVLLDNLPIQCHNILSFVVINKIQIL